MREHPQEARRLLASLLGGKRVTFTPVEDAQGRRYAFSGEAALSGFFQGILAKRSEWLVTPAGFEPAISTLKGSRPWPG